MVTGFLLLDIWLSDVPYKLKMMQSALHHLALPTLVLAVPATLEVMHITQARAGYVMKQNYIKIAKTRGWTPFRVWRTHIICNTLPALLPMIARTFILIFAFGMLIENIFSWGGIGRWLINALAIQDYNAISAGVVAIGVFVLLVDMVTGFVRVMLDPSDKRIGMAVIKEPEQFRETNAFKAFWFHFRQDKLALGSFYLFCYYWLSFLLVVCLLLTIIMNNLLV